MSIITGGVTFTGRNVVVWQITVLEMCCLAGVKFMVEDGCVGLRGVTREVGGDLDGELAGKYWLYIT